MDISPSDSLVTDIDLDLSIQSNQLGVPYLENWLNQVWCIEPQAGHALAEQIKLLDIKSHLSQHQQSAAERTTQRADSKSVAVIRLHGPLQKHASSFSSAGSTVLARRDIRNAVRDPDIGSIFLSIESPGGTSAGTYELAEEVRKAKQIKPVIAHATDIMASAAYWAAAHATKISMNAPGNAGSIGTYLTAIDSSVAAAQKGIRVITISTGEFKGMGAAGTQLSESHLSYLQELVNSTNQRFLQGVQDGRSLSKSHVSELADGRVFDAETSLSKRLIDTVQTFDEAFSDAVNEAEKHFRKSKPSKRGHRMSDTTAVTTVEELKAACPGASAEFLLSALEKNLSMSDAVGQWNQTLSLENANLGTKISELTEQLATVTKERDDARAEIEQLKTAAPGATPLKTGETVTTFENATQEYWSKVRAQQEKGEPRAEAMKVVNKMFPQLREAMTQEFNTNRR